MANKNLFQDYFKKLLPKADAVNEEGGKAYSLSPKHALAQYAATGCLNTTFYATDEQQFKQVIDLCQKVDAAFIAKTAVYARRSGHMKDMPALLCAILSIKGPDELEAIFDEVIDTPKMLRNFVQIIRSGAVGRKSLGSKPKRLIQHWLAKHSDRQIFYGSVGQSPSMADIIKMVHPRPETKTRESLYAYLIGKQYALETLPEITQNYECYKKQKSECSEFPDVPFQMLTSLNLNKQDWTHIAKNASWQMTRMNLNTFKRHGVLDDPNMIEVIAKRLKNPELVRKARVFPYQLMTAYHASSMEMPRQIVDALQDAMEISLANVPKIQGSVYVFPDVSGSMQSPVTGFRTGATTAARCIDVAALVAAAVVKVNPYAQVIPFENDIVKLKLNSRDSIMTNAEKLASFGGGGTNCSAPLCHLNYKRAKGDLLIYVSDNQSWIDTTMQGWMGNVATKTMQEWKQFKARNPKANLVCIDIQPYMTTQAKEGRDIFNIAGFSDQVFTLLSEISKGNAEQDYWVKQIEAISYESQHAA